MAFIDLNSRLWQEKTSQCLAFCVKWKRGSPNGVMINAVKEFEFQSRYYVHFRTNTLGKDLNLLIRLTMG